jgi:hypothetical protein
VAAAELALGFDIGEESDSAQWRAVRVAIIYDSRWRLLHQNMCKK